MKKLGLIVNPIAGLGGAVGLKGTDGSAVLAEALKLGAQPRSQERAFRALEMLSDLRENIECLTCSGPMGESVARRAGFSPRLVYRPFSSTNTLSTDTKKAAENMVREGVDLLLFAGGDGTARDIFTAVEDKLVVLGIPAGVKIHSAAFAANPGRAGELAQLYLTGRVKSIRDAEVMDINEDDYRNEILSARLYGYLRMPYRKRWVQTLKAGSPESERYNQDAIACDIIEAMSDRFYYLIGPGTTTRAIMKRLSLEHSLLGVDLVHQKKLLEKDLNESQIMALIKNKPVKIIITPVGGQGYILGRGNQQLSPPVIRRVGSENIIIIAGKQKINSLMGSPLLVDTGDKAVDQLLSGHKRIVTGYHESIVYKVSI